jgi:plasmid stabilization system protein ParE
MKISWSPQAKKEYEKILMYLNEFWSLKEIENFIIKTETVLNGIQENPYMFVKSTKKKNVCKALINKQNSVFYYIKPLKKEIVLLSFWDNRKKPKKQKY